MAWQNCSWSTWDPEWLALELQRGGVSAWIALYICESPWTDSKKWYVQEGTAFLTPRGEKDSTLIRAVMVGNSIGTDSQASDSDKRPRYFTKTEGDNESAIL